MADEKKKSEDVELNEEQAEKVAGGNHYDHPEFKFDSPVFEPPTFHSEPPTPHFQHHSPLDKSEDK